MLIPGTIGVHPPGALGVALFVHARADCFIGMSGDGITRSVQRAGSILLDAGGRVRPVPLDGRIYANLLEADTLKGAPELLMVCCNPAQLPSFTRDVTCFLESLAQRGRLRSVRDVARVMPILLILPNGILAEQTRRTFVEQLTESMLMDRLPGVDEAMIDRLSDRLVRGVSFQAGERRGSGSDTIYVLQKKGSVVFAGGGAVERERVEAILSAHGYQGRQVRDVPATRIEFDKAMISIVLNVGGLIHVVGPDGRLIDLRMGDLCLDSEKRSFVEQVTRAVFDVGRAIGAYAPADDYDAVWSEHRATILSNRGHVTSSIKAFRDALERGLDSVELFSNEEWILSPLSRYAARARLHEQENLFRSLRRQVQASMARAIRHRRGPNHNGHAGAQTMRLVAHRNIGIELFEEGSDDLVLVGTMLDSDHLIKLELTVHVPDEQITRSRLDMVRVPFPVCREVERIAERLVGLRIQRGVLAQIGQRVGGGVGCSHIKEIATDIVYFVGAHLMRRHAGLDPLDPGDLRISPDERFRRTRDFLQGSCLAYTQATPQALDERIGIRRVGEAHTCPLALGEFEPSIGALLMDRGKKWGEKTYLRYRMGDTVREITWADFTERVFQMARHLIDLGVRPGERIGMVSENRPEMYLMELAAMSIGAVSVPVFAGYHRPQIQYVLRHSRPRFVVVSGPHQLEKIDREEHPWVERWYAMDFDESCRAWGALDLASLSADGGATMDRLRERIDATGPGDWCLVMYTSGTTGPPKGVRLCHRNLISQQKAVSLIWDVGPDDVFMSYLPWHHSFGALFERFMTLYNGCELCLDDSRGRDIDRLVDNWARFRPTIFFSVPRVHDLLVTRCREDDRAAEAVLRGRLRFVFTAAASLPARVESAYRQNGIPVLEGWGLTETSPCVTATTGEGGWKSGFVGSPIPGVSVRIGSDREILVKGPNVMQGYLDDAEATAQVIDEDGWFHTGDLGEFTKNGLRIFGRKDGAFKLTTGERIDPQRIENTLVNESPYIGMALIVGSGRDFVGALIYPDMNRLGAWARDHGVAGDRLIETPEVRELFSAELERINRTIEVGYQRVARAILDDRELSIERGELTPSAKIVRKKVLDSCARKVEAMFEPKPPEGVITVGQAQLQRA